VISGEAMSELAQTVTPQGLLAVCDFIDVPLETVIAARPRLIGLLANVRDPGNAGTVLRTADAAGADAVIFADASVDLYNGKCVRASAGSLFHLPVVAGTRLPETVTALRAAGLRVIAADGQANVTLDDPAVTGQLGVPTAWLFGNEAWGLPPDLLALADASVAVPIYGRAESLNLAAAAAVCLYASAAALRTRPSIRDDGTLIHRVRRGESAPRTVSSHYDHMALRVFIVCKETCGIGYWLYNAEKSHALGVSPWRFHALESDHIPSPASWTSQAVVVDAAPAGRRRRCRGGQHREPGRTR
jgi:RNA methyltransferase, TrmH family